MKSLLTAALILVSSAIFAQSNPPSNGYWTVETNVKDKSCSIVSFYDLQNALIKRDTCNLYLDAKKPRVAKRLNKQLAILQPALAKKQ